MKYFIILLFMIGCNDPEQKITIPTNDTGKYGALIPYKENVDPEAHYSKSVKDTLTPDGWKIEYLVKNDSTKHKDLYIQWSKETIKRTYCAHNILELQGYFTPVLRTENKDYIFMESEVRDGDAVLILPKDKTTPHLQFSYVIGYSPEYGQIAYIPESSYSNDYLDAEAYDLNTGKTRSVRFRKPCSVLPENSCLLEAIFDGKQIKIMGNDDGSNTGKEIQIITF